MRVQKRKVVIRLFSGVAGSPLAKISEAVQPISVTPSAEAVEILTEQILTKRKPGPARIYADAAARQRACRERKARKAAEAAEWKNYQDIIRQHNDMKGRLPGESSGGYDAERIASVCDAIRRDEEGRRVRPQGHGLKSHEDKPGLTRKGMKISQENDETFINKRRFRINWNLTDRDVEHITEGIAGRIFTGQDRTNETRFDPCVEDIGVRHGLLVCKLCSMTVNIWLQAVSHVESCHADVVRREVRRSTPEHTTGEVPLEFYESEQTRIIGLKSIG